VEARILEMFMVNMLRHKVAVCIMFATATAICLCMALRVSVNYNMVDYLPEKAPSTIALKTMNDAYDKAVPNLRVMVKGVGIPEALEYKARLANVKGVSDISWLDDQLDPKVPLAFQDEKTVADWYVNSDALFLIVLGDEAQVESLEDIREIIGGNGALSGNPVDTVNAQISNGTEIQHMLMIIIPMLFLILLFTTTAWVEPALFLINLGVAVALNMGTNIFLGEISFVTKTTATILQLACSMDYAIFLLDRFAEIRGEGLPPEEAMAKAVAKSISSISASGLTTVVGFAALCIMQFRIGPDMGIVLAKGIVFSLLTTLIFMPCLTLSCYKWIDKTAHRSFMPSFSIFGRCAERSKIGVIVIVAVLLLPCYLAQSQTSFVYGMSKMSAPDSQVSLDKQAINNIFGESASFALLTPKGNLEALMALNNEIKSMPEVSSVKSYVEIIGNAIPEEFVPEDKLSILNSGQYTRMVITARVEPESEETFAFVQRLRDIAQGYYSDNYFLAGEVVNVYDMKQTITSDTIKVNIVSILAILFILLLTFKSLSLPFILLLTIESSIFINVAVPYFAGETINYIGFLIISSVQLGATIDYAILFTNRYIENRENSSKLDCARKTISDTAGSIVTSGGILTIAGLALGFGSSNLLISQLGFFLGRGAALSMALVLLFLPALLVWFEKIILITSKGLDFKPIPLCPEKHAETGDNQSVAVLSESFTEVSAGTDESTKFITLHERSDMK
jgi:predicted RND superfamily exporter protein